MPSITIRNISPEVHRRLRIRAAENHNSMQQEAKSILENEVAKTGQPLASHKTKWADEIVSRMQDVGGVELDIPGYDDGVEPPDFSHGNRNV